jgi:hypothetical protein
VKRAVFRRITQSLQWALIAIAIFPVPSAKADTNPIITEITDFWFSYSEPTQFLAQTYQSPGFESDPQLWLYNDDTGELIISNDDYIGLQSNIDLEVPAGNYRLRAGTCCWEPDVWRDGVVWNIQYELSFNGNPVNTTTTIPETTTTWVPTTTSTTSTTTTSTTIAPTTTVPVTEVPTTEATTTTEVSTTTNSPTTTEITSTTVAVTVAPSTMPTTSQSVGTVEVPQTSLTPTTTLSPFFPTPLTTSSTSVPPTVTSAPTTIPEIPESTEPPITTVPEEETVIPDNPTTEEINQLADELVSSIDELSDEEITNLVESIDIGELTEESISAVFSEEVLSELSDEQVTQLIDAIVPSELSDEQASALSEALTDAPDDVKEEFQDQINVFGGQFDNYVPTGSAVSVGARRAIVAATAVIFAMPAPVTRKQ